MSTHSSILAWKKFHGRRNLVGYSPQGLKESDMSEHSRSPPHPSLRLYCEETSMECVVSGIEKSVAISNLLKAPNPLPSALTKCAQKWAGLRVGWGELPLQNQGETHCSGGPPGSKFNPFVAEPKPPAPAGSLSPACKEAPILVPRAESMAIPDLVLPVPLSHRAVIPAWYPH